MCCFSGRVMHVSKTSIFARAVAGVRQVLAYEMSLAAKQDVAMILPLPVPPGAPEDAVRFVDLSGYATLFGDLRRGFPEPIPRARSLGLVPQPAAQRPLEVHAVGAFEASYVPTVADFARLDPRFQMPPAFWSALPDYASFGFAVFKLQDLGPRARPVHPMAFEFPRRDPATLFFPTVHVHDGKVATEADFDHTLYAQADAGVFAPLGTSWEPSPALARTFVDVGRTRGVVAGDQPCWRQRLVGRLPNRDTQLAT